MFGLLTLALSLALGLILMQVAPLSANPIAQQMQHLSAWAAGDPADPHYPQLVGEKLLGVQPFLAAI